MPQNRITRISAAWISSNCEIHGMHAGVLTATSGKHWPAPRKTQADLAYEDNTSPFALFPNRRRKCAHIRRSGSIPHDMFSVPGILVEVGCFYRVRMTIHQRGQAIYVFISTEDKGLPFACIVTPSRRFRCSLSSAASSRTHVDAQGIIPRV
jgi:hypothetical protein